MRIAGRFPSANRVINAFEHVLLSLLPVLFGPPFQASILKPKCVCPLADGFPEFAFHFGSLLARADFDDDGEAGSGIEDRHRGTPSLGFGGGTHHKPAGLRFGD